MARYLVVAHQTVVSVELVERVSGLASTDPSAEFVLLVPATAVRDLSRWVGGESTVIAQLRAEAARSLLERAGARIVGTRVGDESPLQAIDDELRQHPDYYDALIIATLPPRLSRWLKLDLPRRARRKFGLPVDHVVAESWAETGPREVRFDRILVPLDGSPDSQAVLSPIRCLARRLGSRVTLVHVLGVAKRSSHPRADADLAEQLERARPAAEGYLEDMASIFRRDGILADTVVLAGKPATATINSVSAGEGDYDLVGMAHPASGGVAGAILSSMSSQVVHACPCPLFLVRSQCSCRLCSASGDIARLLVPLGGSNVGETALPFAEELALRMGLPVTLIQAVPWTTDVMVRSSLDTGEDVEGRLEHLAAQYLAGIGRKMQELGIDTDWTTLRGSPAEEILERAGRDEATLIIMATHGSSRLGRVVLGSVTDAVVRGAHGSVLVMAAPSPNVPFVSPSSSLAAARQQEGIEGDDQQHI